MVKFRALTNDWSGGRKEALHYPVASNVNWGTLFLGFNLFEITNYHYSYVRKLKAFFSFRFILCYCAWEKYRNSAYDGDFLKYFMALAKSFKAFHS